MFKAKRNMKLHLLNVRDRIGHFGDGMVIIELRY